MQTRGGAPGPRKSGLAGVEGQHLGVPRAGSLAVPDFISQAAARVTGRAASTEGEATTPVSPRRLVRWGGVRCSRGVHGPDPQEPRELRRGVQETGLGDP